MNAFWSGRRVAVTGSSGFLGSYLLEALARRGAEAVLPVPHEQYDLVRRTDVERMYDDLRPDLVIHAAAVVGGIAANRTSPGEFFYRNLLMGVQLIEEGRRRGLPKLVLIGTVCSYPKFTPVPFREEDLWNGYPEETNAAYGLAKKALLVQAEAYRRQYGFNAIYLLPANLYGPRDHFDLHSSHVIPALIRKCVEAAERGAPHVVCWGTGSASREFLYAADAAEGILLAAEHYDGGDPVNLGTGCEITIRDLARKIADLTGFRGEFRWDASQPDGQPRRCLDVSRARSLFGFAARTGLDEGLQRTIAWYREQRGAC